MRLVVSVTVSPGLTALTVIPNCRSYDPTFNYELAVILHDGLWRMYQQQESVFYYITVMNENYHHPEMPAGVEDGIRRGLYRFGDVAPGGKGKHHRVQLLGSGTIFREVIAAAEESDPVAHDIVRRECDALATRAQWLARRAGEADSIEREVVLAGGLGTVPFYASILEESLAGRLAEWSFSRVARRPEEAALARAAAMAGSK
jgi:pyruvate dehydrogenase complex dehydrogenase (E1) component